MGYAVYEQGSRWAGYGVPAECDMLGCAEEIDRGLGYMCEATDGTPGCELFFCAEHLGNHDCDDIKLSGKPDSTEWLIHILNDESWAQWRELNPARCAAYQSRVLGEVERRVDE